MLGADHHGYVARIRASIEALGADPEAFEALIMSLVHIVEGGERAQMSKRSGDFVSLDELLDDIGVDATRWFMLWRSHETTVDLDLELARSQSSENPVYYVQYAHARIASILRKAGAAAEEAAAGLDPEALGSALEPSEKALIKRLLEFPDEVRESAARRAPHRICAYSTAVAADFHAFYRDCQVVGAEGEGVERSRLALCLCDEADDRRGARAARDLGPRADVMLGGRRKLPVLAEISGPAAGDVRAWSLRRADLEALGGVREQGLDGHRVVLVAGAEALARGRGRARRRRRRRRPAHGAARVRPGAAAAGGRARAGPGAGAARVPALGGERGRDPAAAGPRRPGGPTASATPRLRRRRPARRPTPRPCSGSRASATCWRNCAPPTTWSSSPGRRSARPRRRWRRSAAQADTVARRDLARSRASGRGSARAPAARAAAPGARRRRRPRQLFRRA